MTVADENGKQAQRKAAMAVLAHSDAAEIARHLEPIEVPAYENLRGPADCDPMVSCTAGYGHCWLRW